MGFTTIISEPNSAKLKVEFMKTLLKTLLLIIAFLFVSCVYQPYPQHDYKPAKETRYYNEHGKYTDKSQQQRNTIRYYDKDGRYTGSGRVR